MNSEQIKSLERNKTVTLYEKTDTLMDITTGEIIDRTAETIKKTSTEPDYIKLYYRTMLAFNGIEDVPINFVISIAQFISWTNDAEPMIFRNDKLVRERICKAMGDIKKSMYTRYLKRCREHGLLIPKQGYRGVYEVNPFFIAKGKWDSIKQLRTNFDFVSGQWKRISETEPEDQEMSVS